MEQAMKYRLQGERRRGKSAGVEKFDTIIIAKGYDEAQTVARWNWKATWPEVKFTSVTQVP